MSEGGLPEADCPVRRGDFVAGKYRIERVLGAGGMGVVVAATQTDLERVVALKFLRPRVLERADHVARFAREARAAAKLESEHVARVLDVGTHEGGASYIVMEYLEGEDLGRLIARRGPLPPAEAVAYVLEASEAVAEAHALGIVHRDLKPANLFLATRSNGRPVIKVLDFGLSKFAASDDGVTSESSILGSPLYMSPEQLLSARKAGLPSDIWSLGVTLYELLTAEPAFSGQRMPELIASILHGREPPLVSLRPEVPAGLAAAVHRCLEKDPSRRFADIAELAFALAPFAPPTHEACSAQIAHVLGRRSTPEAPPQDAPQTPSQAQTRPETRAAGGDRVVSESLGGASQSLAMLPSAPSAKSLRPDPQANTGRMRVLGGVAALAVAATVGFVAMTRSTVPSGIAPVAGDAVSATVPSAASLVDRKNAPLPEEPMAVPVPSLANVPAPANSATARVPPPRSTVAPPPPKSHVPPPTAPAPSPPSPQTVAAPSSAPAPSPSASVDALTKLRHL